MMPFSMQDRIVAQNRSAAAWSAKSWGSHATHGRQQKLDWKSAIERSFLLPEELPQTIVSLGTYFSPDPCRAAGTAIAKSSRWRCIAQCRTKGIARMEIRFISSLTAEDEDYFAPAVLKAVSALLDQLPIAYTMRIETTGAQVFQHSHPAFEATVEAAECPVTRRDTLGTTDL
jgi:hypothetical protein